MLDPNILRQHAKDIASQLARRGFTFDWQAFEALEVKRKALQIETESLQAERNSASKSIGQAKSKGQDVAPLLDKIAHLGDALQSKKNELERVQADIKAITMALPNVPDKSVPDGQNEHDNQQIHSYGEPKVFPFEPQSHDVLGEALQQIDFALGAKLTGSRFVVLKNQIARLHRALTQWMLDVQTKEHGYQEVYVPYLVNDASLLGTGQLPKFGADLFQMSGEQGYYLIPTAEVPLTNLLRDEIVAESELPLQFAAHTPCFRSEAGSYGKDTKGMIRQHQFEKVELVWFTTPDHSMDVLEQLRRHAEIILERLELPYRTMVLCAGDMGASSCKTYDLEVWLPSQKTYREISSCSNMGDFQARRMQARYKPSGSEQSNVLLHTLNGSGLAVGRTLVAVLENYQMEDGRIEVPHVLWDYMDGVKII